MPANEVLKQFIATVVEDSSLTGVSFRVYCKPADGSDLHTMLRKVKQKPLIYFTFILVLVIAVASIGALAQLLTMLAGHAVLRAAYSYAEYHTAGINAVHLGAVGGAMLYLIGVMVTLPLLSIVCTKWLSDAPRPESRGIRLAALPIQVCIEAANGAAAGALGARMLHGRGANAGVDPLHAARMGAVGAAIISAGFLTLAVLGRKGKNKDPSQPELPTNHNHSEQACFELEDMVRKNRLNYGREILPGAKGWSNV